MLEHLPERDRPAVRRRLRRAWEREDHLRAEEDLQLLAAELEHSHPGASASLAEGLEETLTVTRLGVRGQLRHRARGGATAIAHEVKEAVTV